MKLLIRLLILVTVTLTVLAAGFSVAVDKAPLAAGTKGGAKLSATAQKSPAAAKDALKITPLDLLKEPAKYLNKTVEFEGTFNSFSSLGLDYKRAFRNSKDYVSLLILRPDVTRHKIPLAELKLIYPRKKSEAVMHLESGDVISVRGTLFSTALNDPWVDVEQIDIIRKINPKPGAKTDEECC